MTHAAARPFHRDHRAWKSRSEIAQSQYVRPRVARQSLERQKPEYSALAGQRVSGSAVEKIIQVFRTSPVSPSDSGRNASSESRIIFFAWIYAALYAIELIVAIGPAVLS
jgi:hypothetical protein